MLRHTLFPCAPLFRSLALAGAAVVNLALDAVLVPRYGMHGAAVAASVGYGSMAVLHVLAARRVGFDPLADLRPLRLVVAVALGGAATVWVARLVPGPWPALAVVPVAGFSLFAAAAFLSGALDTDEVSGLAGSMPGLSQILARSAGSGRSSAGRCRASSPSPVSAGSVSAGSVSAGSVSCSR